MSIDYDRIISTAPSLPPPPENDSKTTITTIKPKLSFTYPLDKLHEYKPPKQRIPNNPIQYSDLPDYITLKDKYPDLYRSYYNHRDPNLIGHVRIDNGQLMVSNRETLIHVQQTLRRIDMSKITMRGKFKVDDVISCVEVVKMLGRFSPIDVIHKVKGEKGIDLDRLVRYDEGLRLMALCMHGRWREKNSWYNTILNTKCVLEDVNGGENDADSEELRFNRIMEELENDMIKFNLTKGSSKLVADALQKQTKSKTKPQSKSKSISPTPEPVLRYSNNDFFRPQELEIRKLKYPIYMSISEDLLSDSSDDELNTMENSCSDTDSDSESESETDDIHSIYQSQNQSQTQNQFELLTSSSSSALSRSSRPDSSPETSLDQDFGMTEQEYSEFVYDEMDSDPNFIDLVEMLTDLFPTYAKTDLKFRLKLADNVEELMEELFIETESQDLLEQQRQEELTIESTSEPVYSDSVYQLREMFPNVQIGTIDKKLRENNNDLDETIRILLNLPSTEFSSVKQNKFTINEWNQISNLVTKVRKFLGVNDDTFVVDNNDIVHYVRKSGCNYYDALTGIIMNCQPMVLQTVRQKGGRVQRGNKRVGPNRTTTKLVKSNYRYSPISKEAKELWEIAASNQQVKNANKNLLTKALEFFQGNVFKVIELVSELSSNQQSSYIKPTIKFVPKVENDPYILVKTKFTNYANKRSSKAVLGGSPLEQNRFYQFIDSGEVDLHGFKLTEAIRLTRLVLQHWWDEELKNRELNGHFDKYGDKASIGPVGIITGRGIHSAGGIPILKRYVKDYLQTHSYIFNEQIGRFEVTGKRRR
ncbi:CUE2 Ubiquitin-binding protein CUE2 [Candida maltosa Xu316]